jgi:hypothetical protein
VMSQQVQERDVRVSSRAQADGAVVLLAAGLAAVAWTVATQAAGIALRVRSGSGTTDVNVVSVVVTVAVVGLAGLALLRLLERRTASALRTWTWVAVAVLGVSFLGPLGASTLGAGLALAVLHLVVGGTVIGGLRRTHAGGAAAATRVA